MLIVTTVATVAITVVLVKIYIKVTSGKCTCNNRLDGKTVIITGANAGIGKETAIDLASRGARVILACRNLHSANQAKDEIIAKTGNPNISVRKIDMESLESVRNFAKTIHETEERLDVLINNAGAGGLGNHLTNDGLLIGMQVNHFAPFLLTNLLLDLLKKSAPSRIVTVSSMLHTRAKLNINDLNEPLDAITVYCNSKLCNLLMSNELSRRLEGTGVTSNSLHPGAVRTALFQHMPQPLRSIWNFYAVLFFKSVKEGAQTTIHLAVSEDLCETSGKYFSDCVETSVSEDGGNMKLAQQLWNLSEDFVKLEEKHI